MDDLDFKRKQRARMEFGVEFGEELTHATEEKDDQSVMVPFLKQLLEIDPLLAPYRKELGRR